VTATPGQTVGPFFGYSLPYAGGSQLVPPSHPGSLRVHGLVLDGAGEPIPDALLELWQTDPDGRVVQQPGSLHRDGYTFTGWGRTATDNAGQYSFTTLEPDRFFALTVFARGLLDCLFTRIYLPDGPHDSFLDGVAPDRRPTLIASADADRSLRFDVRLQGEHETVFLAYDTRRTR
jgi:protocatechuate 3,4-dioxygenase alpha subunit